MIRRATDHGGRGTDAGEKGDRVSERGGVVRALTRDIIEIGCFARLDVPAGPCEQVGDEGVVVEAERAGRVGAVVTRRLTGCVGEFDRP